MPCNHLVFCLCYLGEKVCFGGSVEVKKITLIVRLCPSVDVIVRSRYKK